jgi:hypothetical protein
MRKDYFSEILKIHTDSRTEDFSSFCELHELTSDKDKHNSIFCNLADWDDSFTGLLEILVLKEDSLRGIDDEEYLSFLKVAIPSYLFWMNVLRENLCEFNELAKKNSSLNIADCDLEALMLKLESVRVWTNFQKHPGHAIKIHHPRIEITGDNEQSTEINNDEYVFDCLAAKCFFSSKKNSIKVQLDKLTQQKTKWVIRYPDFIEMHRDLMVELSAYLSALKHKISHDQTYKEWIEGLYNKPWAEIQD